MGQQQFSQIGLLIRFILRRDRVRLLIWIMSLFIITVATANSFTGLYKTDMERQAVAETMRNPAMVAMVGPGYGIDNYTVGAMMSHQMLLFTAIAVAIMSILLVTRHTRSDEEEGRVELIRSLPVGRLANLSAVVIVMVMTNVALAILIGLGLFFLGIESIDLQGSLLYGAALGGTGLFFTAVTAFFAQATENGRGTIGYSFAVLMIAYLIRAVGDVSNETISWVSPLSWTLQTQVYVNNYWWPLFLTIVLAILIVLFAFYLNAIRDLGAGLIPSKPGKKEASFLLKSSIGLPFRLQKTAIISWAIGMFVLGVSYGSVLGDLEGFIESNEMMAEMIAPAEGFSLTEQYITMLMSIISMISTIPALMFLLKLKSEEKKHHLELILSSAISRTKVMASYFFISFFFGSLMLIISVFGLYAASTGVDDSLSFSVIFQSAIVYLPAMWVMIGLAILLLGLLPSWTSFSWLYLGYSFLVVYFGTLLQFPDWLGKLSPFGHIPKVPVEEIKVLQLVGLLIIAVVLTFLGFKSFNKRDIGV